MYQDNRKLLKSIVSLTVPSFIIRMCHTNVSKLCGLHHGKFENKLYFGVGDFKPSYKHLKENPKFEISAVRNDIERIRISAKAVFDDRPEVVEKAFKTIPSLREQYNGENQPKLATFYTDSLDATIFDLTGKIEKVEL